ncbi:MAG: isopenicillin N synthase family oxygenase [bacterium]|nr:isopenicillin N synthase family oxygenase [bacterium]
MVASIPILDMGPYLSGMPGALDTAAEQLRYALEEIGFFVLINHDVPPSLIDQTFAEAKRFHDLSLEVKMSLKMNADNNGYMAMNRYAVWTSDVNENDKADLNEAFFIKRERPLDDPLRRAERRFAGPNQWPEALPGFRQNVLTYTDAVDALALRVLPICAVALDLAPDYFNAAFAESQFSFRLSHYPPLDAEANQYGIAPHTDVNFLTFLAQTQIPGLQVRMPSGDWLDVPYRPGAFAVNSGDMMQRWSNGRFKSTPHRALLPLGQHRYAIPFFLGPHLDTRIECLSTCQGPDNPPKFPPVTYGDHLAWWYDANYNAAVQQDAD